ncbi:MAG: terpene cyclase/mutase family protein [Phycisphaerales bacterium]|nr:terpene cyclase/mutase family protein [Phycisphaerales bacterium]
MKRTTLSLSGLAFLAFVVAGAAPSSAATPRPQTATEKKALDFLLTQQDKDGAWVPTPGPAVTALVLKSLVQAGHSPDEPALQKALAIIDKAHQKDGGWYIDGHATYNTSITLSALAALTPATRDKYKDQITQAQNFLKSIQSGSATAATDDKGATVDKKHPWYGGWGYGEGSTLKPGRRPDLSNTHFVIEALRDSGLPANDESIQRAVTFLTRSQASEANDLPWSKGRDEGGFIYSTAWNPATNSFGQSPLTKDRDGKDIIAAYGSMTYAGLKSMIYADLKPDDARVKAALRWISNNYSLQINPGLKTDEGLYYYYFVFASTLTALNQDTITDAKGVKHDWRTEFETEMAKRQHPDGSFVNTADKWMESNPVLATTYVVLGLQELRHTK